MSAFQNEFHGIWRIPVCEGGNRSRTSSGSGGEIRSRTGSGGSAKSAAGGSGYCEHGRQKLRCKECCESEFCEHGKFATLCKDCGNSTLCVHGNFKSICKECGGTAYCEHGNQKRYCKECGGGEPPKLPKPSADEITDEDLEILKTLIDKYGKKTLIQLLRTKSTK